MGLDGITIGIFMILIIVMGILIIIGMEDLGDLDGEIDGVILIFGEDMIIIPIHIFIPMGFITLFIEDIEIIDFQDEELFMDMA